MGSLHDRITRLEGRFGAEAGPSKPFAHMKAILDELAALRTSGAGGFRGGVPIVPQDIPRKTSGIRS